ncbi:MAG: type II toxin-antitoxin system VapC family toxin [Xenococcaceae cyanobacterium]
MLALLDTNAFLWWVTDDERLSSQARGVISDPSNTLIFSIVSAWEIVIKANLGKLPLPEPPETYIPNRVSYYGFQTLTIEMKHVLHISKLESHHNDPFDRLLIAQSQVENIPIITIDRKISLYDVEVIW